MCLSLSTVDCLLEITPEPRFALWPSIQVFHIFMYLYSAFLIKLLHSTLLILAADTSDTHHNPSSDSLANPNPTHTLLFKYFFSLEEESEYLWVSIVYSLSFCISFSVYFSLYQKESSPRLVLHTQVFCLILFTLVKSLLVFIFFIFTFVLTPFNFYFFLFTIPF